MKGRRPKQAHLRLIDQGIQLVNPQGSASDDALGPPPSWFSPDHVLAWQHVERSAPLGLLLELDRQLVTQYCVNAVLFEHCAKKIAECGVVVLSPVKKVPMVSPFASEMHKAELALKACIDQLGFSPASRSRIRPQKRSALPSKFRNLKQLKVD